MYFVTYPRPNTTNQTKSITRDEIIRVPRRPLARQAPRRARPRCRALGPAAGEQVIASPRGRDRCRHHGRGGRRRAERARAGRLLMSSIVASVGPVEKVALHRQPGRALRSARRPELAQLLAQLLARRRPVVTDVVAQVLDVPLQVELVLLQPADVELLPRGAAPELARNVLFVVAHNPVFQLSVPG